MNTTKESKLLISIAMCILILGSVLNLNAQNVIKGDASDDAKQKIQELNKKMEEAFRSGDMTNVVQFYAEDATVIIPGGKKIEGRKAIYEYLTSLGKPNDFHIEVTDVNGSGKLLYQVGTMTFSAERNGTTENHSTDQIKVWKRGSDWDYKISVDSFN